MINRKIIDAAIYMENGIREAHRMNERMNGLSLSARFVLANILASAITGVGVGEQYAGNILECAGESIKNAGTALFERGCHLEFRGNEISEELRNIHWNTMLNIMKSMGNEDN